VVAAIGAFWAAPLVPLRKAERRVVEIEEELDRFANAPSADELARKLPELAPAEDECDVLSAKLALARPRALREPSPQELESALHLAAFERSLERAARYFRVGLYRDVAALSSEIPLAPGGERARLDKQMALTLIAAAEPRALAAQRVIPAITVEDADLREVMDQIGRQVGTNIIVEPDIHEKVTISLRGIPWRDAVAVIARMCGCQIDARGDQIVVEQAGGGVRFVGKFEYRDYLVVTLGYRGFHVVCAPDVTGTAPDNFRGISLKELEVELASFHLVARRRGRTILITKEPVDWGLPLYKLDGE
jgi:type II secretory pathway component HofQ